MRRSRQSTRRRGSPDAFGDPLILEAKLDGTVVGTIQPASGTGANALAANDSHLYWTTPGSGSGEVFQANLDGSNQTPIATGLSVPGGVAVSGSHIYWINLNTFGHTAGTLVEANLDGTGATTIATGDFGLGALAANGSNLYWTSDDAFGDPLILEAKLDGTVVGTIQPASGTGANALAVSAPVPTTLKAHPQWVLFPPPNDSVGLFKLSATLTAGGGGVPGQTVVFNAGATQVCRAMTNSNGTATCNAGLFGELAVLLSDSYTATFTAKGNYLGSSASTAAVELGNGLALLASDHAQRGVRLSGTLTRQGNVYATITSRTRHGHTSIKLNHLRQLTAGRYTLTLHVDGRRLRRTIRIR